MKPSVLRVWAPHFERDVERAVHELTVQGWVELEEFVNLDFVRRARREATALLRRGSFRMAGVGRGESWQVRPEIRSDRVHWLDPRSTEGMQATWLEIAELLRQRLNAGLMLGLFDYEAHLALYPPSASYHRHRDHFAGTEDRVLTSTLYFNEDWRREDGGLLRIFVSDTEVVEVLPRAGTLVLFLSHDFEHEVSTARRERWSMTGWYRRRSG